MSTMIGMKRLRRDPMGSLLAADDAALQLMAQRELLGETTADSSLAELSGVRRAIARQQRDVWVGLAVCRMLNDVSQ